MGILQTVKRVVKSNGLLYAQAAALRSRQPLANAANLRRNLLFSKVMSRTLVSYDRLVNTYDLAQAIEAQKLDGAFVECGVWRGGVAALLALVTKEAGSGRKTHLFDSFEGLPNPTVQDGEQARGMEELDGALKPIGLYVATVEDVSHYLFDELHLDRDQVLLHKGWFQETMPRVRDQIGPISLLRIDADWYESVKVCLDHLYDLVVEDGYVILDDYGTYPGCRKAYEEFRTARGLNVALHRVDVNGVWFQKPRSATNTPAQQEKAHA